MFWWFFKNLSTQLVFNSSEIFLFLFHIKNPETLRQDWVNHILTTFIKSVDFILHGHQRSSDTIISRLPFIIVISSPLQQQL